jgi:hypothetical protein
MKNVVFWDVTPPGSCKNRRIGGTYSLYHQGDNNRLLVTANIVPSSPILVTLMMEALGFSETAVLTRAIRRNILEDGILQCVYSLMSLFLNVLMQVGQNYQGVNRFLMLFVN